MIFLCIIILCRLYMNNHEPDFVVFQSVKDCKRKNFSVIVNNYFYSSVYTL